MINVGTEVLLPGVTIGVFSSLGIAPSRANVQVQVINGSLTPGLYVALAQDASGNVTGPFLASYYLSYSGATPETCGSVIFTDKDEIFIKNVSSGNMEITLAVFPAE